MKNRTIKFKIWDKKRKRFGYLLLSPWGIDIPIESYLPLTLHRSDDDEIYRIEYDDIEFLEYTGLTDKNGKEIYEGDIVSYIGFYDGDSWEKEGVGVIHWDEEGHSVFKIYESGEECYLCSTFDLSKNYDGEVIGNIYENPELL